MPQGLHSESRWARSRRWPRDWFIEKFRQAAPQLTARQLREKVLAANCRLVGMAHLAVQARRRGSHPEPCAQNPAQRHAVWC